MGDGQINLSRLLLGASRQLFRNGRNFLGVGVHFFDGRGQFLDRVCEGLRIEASSLTVGIKNLLMTWNESINTPMASSHQNG
ncbi:MAG: hypothetical protein ACFFC7_06135 [Candidatus Hermodarchaeota archaeon]